MSNIYWLNPISGSFTNASDWSGGKVPGASDNAILDAVGANPYTVTSSVSETVNSIQTDAEAILSITGGTFTADTGTGSGANAGIILVGAGATLVTGGVVDNTGTIALDGAKGSFAELLFNSSQTLTGGGQILLDGQGYDHIGGLLHAGQVLITNADNTIVGSGTIGDKHTEFFNGPAGVIDASGSAALVINSGLGGFENNGLLEATGTGGLTLRGKGFGGPNGVILAGDGSTVRMNRTRVEGGTLESVGSGIIVATSTYLVRLTNDANLLTQGDCYVVGNIINNGTISFHRGSFDVLAPTTIRGTGVIDVTGGEIAGSRQDGQSILTLASGTITGSGSGVVGVGGGSYLTLIIGAAGVIDGNAKESLTINTKTPVIANAGTIESTGAGGVIILDSIDNTGLLAADDGTLSVGSTSNAATIDNTGTLSVMKGGELVAYGAVSGKGVAVIGGGTLDFLSSFDEDVTFSGKSGTLELAMSQGFTDTVKGFSTKGGTSLDLGDIGFVGANEATFSGTAMSGVLTVTDGTHTANINLKGDYLSSTFVASSDGHGGVMVTTQNTEAIGASPLAFVSAMAGFGASGGSAIQAGEAWSTRELMLASPRVAAA